MCVFVLCVCVCVRACVCVCVCVRCDSFYIVMCMSIYLSYTGTVKSSLGRFT